MTFNSFTYNGQNSIDDFDMYFETMPNLPLSISNDSEQITVVLGFETNKSKTLRIRKWLSEGTGKLSFNFDDRVWKVNNILAQESSKNATFTIISIIFEVESECLLNDEQDIIISEKFDSILIYNRGNFESYPLITITGLGNVTINLNDYVICTIEDINGEITIDSEIQECWNGNQLSIYSVKNSDFYGDFPVFQEGMNRISIDSTLNSISKVTINPRWRI